MWSRNQRGRRPPPPPSAPRLPVRVAPGGRAPGGPGARQSVARGRCVPGAAPRAAVLARSAVVAPLSPPGQVGREGPRAANGGKPPRSAGHHGPTGRPQSAQGARRRGATGDGAEGQWRGGLRPHEPLHHDVTNDNDSDARPMGDESPSRNGRHADGSIGHMAMDARQVRLFPRCLESSDATCLAGDVLEVIARFGTELTC